MCALRPACRSHKQERCRSPLRQIACKKVRYLIWKVKSTRYDASDFFRQAEPRREERRMVETRGPLRSFVSVGLRLCRISSTMIVPPIRVEHSIRLKAAPTPFVENKAE